MMSSAYLEEKFLKLYGIACETMQQVSQDIFTVNKVVQLCQC